MIKRQFTRSLAFLLATLTAPLVHAQYGLMQIPNAPFSAEIETFQVQTLAEGINITAPGATTKLYRDVFGRTRSESYRAAFISAPSAPELNNITIVDPIEGARYVLNPARKTAQRISMARQTAASLPTIHLQPMPPAPPTPGAQIGRVMMLYPGPHSPNANQPVTQTESLGEQNIEGLICLGHRITMTYAVGKIGNDRELVVTHETWASTELGSMIVLDRESDPRTGVRTIKMTGVSRAEPDPSLFQVPADYTLDEAPHVVEPSRVN